MRFASRVISHGASARGYVLAAVAVVALGLAACNDEHIGRACNTNAPADAGAASGVSIISSPSLQCPSRICIQPEGAPAEASMCTASCTTDDDCSDPDPGTTCKKGFVCAWPTTAGPFCCQKMCVCHDFVTVPKGGFPVPATCMSPGSSPDAPNPATCQNVH
jgi:hypothetical protein